MARLQILELPEGANDDRPPFVLIVDQATESTAKALDIVGRSTAELVGARTVLVFEETIDIPGNDKAQSDGARAIQNARLRAASEEGWTGRPMRPDGTPYGYSEINADGWEACEGCRTWGQWTAENPHDCPGTYIKAPIARPAADA